MLRRFLISFFVLLTALIFATKVVEWWTEAWWFEETGYASVYRKIFLSRLLAFVVGATFFGGLVGIHVLVAWRVVSDHMTSRGIIAEVAAIGESGQTHYFERYHRWFWAIGVALPTLLAGQLISSRWMLWHHLFTPISAGEVEPLSGRDLGFYLLQLPALNFVWSFIFVTLLWALALAVFIYGLEGMLRLDKSSETKNVQPIPQAVLRHLVFIVATLLLWKAIGYQLSPFNLLTNHDGSTFSVGYTTVHWRLPILQLLSLIAFSAALATFRLSRRAAHEIEVQRAWWPLQAYVVASVLIGSFLPWMIQRILVEPDEQTREQPHIARHIDWTRRAYGLNEIRLWRTGVLQADLDTSASLLPAWPPDALLNVINGVKNGNSKFHSRRISLGRYFINGEKRSVYVAARELAPGALLNPDWRGTHLLHNFGDGVVIADAQRTTATGQPIFFEIPTARNTNQSTLGVRHPQLFFAEFPAPAPGPPFVPRTRTISSPPGLTPSAQQLPGQQLPGQQLPGQQLPARPSNQTPTGASSAQPSTPAYVVLNSRNTLHGYTGEGGVPILSVWRKWLLAWRFMDFRLALSPEIGKNSRVLWHRRIVERCRELAPFLSFEAAEPYPIVTDGGRILWILDGFTLSNSYPHAAAQEGANGVNYIHNSIKATVDAYDGTVRFYTVDATDPIMRSNRAIFPQLFTAIEEMPPDVRRHLRYSSALLQAQSQVWGRYHDTDSVRWMAAENVWAPLHSMRGNRFLTRDASLVTPLTQWLPSGTPNSNRSTPGSLAEVNNLTTLSLLAPVTPSNIVAGSTFPQTSKVVSILLATPSLPLREWRPQTPVSLPSQLSSSTALSSSQVVAAASGMQTAQHDRTHIALLPYNSSLLYLMGQINSNTQNAPSLSKTWGILTANNNRIFARRTDAISAFANVDSFKRPARNNDSKPRETLRSPTATAEVEQLRSLFRAMQSARQRGDWTAYGEAERQIERLLERYNK